MGVQLGMEWKEDWAAAKEQLTDWWQGKGFVISVFAPREKPRENVPRPNPPASLEERWLDPGYRVQQAEYEMSRTYYGGGAFPYFDTHIGPGNLATFIGSVPRFSPITVWFEPCSWRLADDVPCTFTPDNYWFIRQREILRHGVKKSGGRYLVGMPDLIENIDTLVSLYGVEEVLLGLVEHPEIIKRRLREINQIYATVFDLFYEEIKDEDQGNAYCAFKIWGPGKTAKVQCDTAAMFSRDMFAEFVVPFLKEQCQALDFSLFHLDGTHCLVHLEELLRIEELNAIEWTPQYGVEGGGDPVWYGLYRKILEGGKGVQAIGVKPGEVIPLLNAVGTNGVFMLVNASSEQEAKELLHTVQRRFRR